VAVPINKAMIEIPPRFVGKPPVHPAARADTNMFTREWRGAQGLAEAARYYGQWMHEEAEKRIGHLYPKVEVSAEMAKAPPAAGCRRGGGGPRRPRSAGAKEVPQCALSPSPSRLAAPSQLSHPHATFHQPEWHRPPLPVSALGG
jgi:hypothetical protein